MSNPWQNLNPPVTLSKMFSIPPPIEAALSRMERESPRPVIGMLPRALKFKVDGLPRDQQTCPLPVDAHRPDSPERTEVQFSLSTPAEQVTSQPPVIPRVRSENNPRCESARLLAPSAQNATLARSRVEALNGRLIVRSRIDVGQHPCHLDATGAQELVVELRRQALTRDLVLLESGVRGVRQDVLSPLVEASVQLAAARPIHVPIGLKPERTPRRLVGPRLRIPLPEVEQPQ